MRRLEQEYLAPRTAALQWWISPVLLGRPAVALQVRVLVLNTRLIVGERVLAWSVLLLVLDRLCECCSGLPCFSSWSLGFFCMSFATC
jgi:hypothetical protein